MIEERGVNGIDFATFSACRSHRYTLARYLRADDGPAVTFVMLNPSTANAFSDDPTVRRCIGFARSWGFSQLRVVNLFSYRSTDPRALRAWADAEGDPQNRAAIEAAAFDADLVVAAWGAHGSLRGRAAEVSARLWDLGPVTALAVTKRGQPRHPLYLRRDLRPRSYYSETHQLGETVAVPRGGGGE